MKSISKIFEISAICLFLASCGSDDIGMPIQLNARNSYQYLFRSYPSPIRLLQVGPPMNCRAVKVGEKPAKSCEVCLMAVILEQDTIAAIRGIKVFSEVDRANFTRAISYSQPDTVPVDGNAVLAISGDYRGLAAIRSVSRNLSGNDLAPLNIQMEGGGASWGSMFFAMGGHQIGADVVLNILATPNGVSRLKELVGGCDGA